MVEVGTIRIKSSGVKPVKMTNTGWKAVKFDIDNILTVIDLFKAEGNFEVLVDKKDPVFLKGQLSSKGLVQGARINILPNGSKLEKAYSLFCPHLKIHDQLSHDHWDVLYQNKGGTWSYIYTLEKREKHRLKKYKKVDKFDKVYDILIKNVEKSLNDSKDDMATPLHTLLNTYMRVGNETYFKAHGHKGLTTLTKKDAKINGLNVNFDYIGKDGVPIIIDQNFSKTYVNRLQPLLKGKGYIFSKDGKVLHENDFKKAFIKYCGEEFYPHIVRSHHATKKVKDFLKNRRKFNKNDVTQLFLEIAHDLGHKKFDKKTNVWKENYVVTVNSYIQPELVKKIYSRME